MRVGGVLVSSHAAGMSALWHDPDFHPVKRFETPTVQKNYDEMPVPTEQVELPDGVVDPFAKLDAVYDTAALQMERGVKGHEFLHGKKAPAAAEVPRAGAEDPTRLMQRPQGTATPAEPGSTESGVAHGRAPAPPAVHHDVHQSTSTKRDREDREHHRAIDAASATYVPGRTSSATSTAAARDAERAARQGALDSAVAVAATFAPMAASQVATSLVQGPLPALAASATHAVEVAGAVASAGEIALVGVHEGLKNPVAEDDSPGPRRGLRRR
jgi:hypothetical protein